MVRVRRKQRHNHRPLKERDLPTVPVREADPHPANGMVKTDASSAAEADPAEEAVRRMIEAAYT